MVAFLAALNTAGNDATPFFLASSQTLYFSSEGHPGLGGYDLFTARKTPAGWEAPRNAGPGFNTSYNDLYPFVRPDGRSGYLSSNRPGSLYLDEKNKACCNDLFAFTLVPDSVGDPPGRDSVAIPPRRDTLATLPPVQDTLKRDRVPEPPQIRDFVGLPLYFDNDEPDKRSRATTTRRNYEETVLTYLERQDEYRTAFARGLAGPAAERATDEIDGFFDHEVRRGYERLLELADLLQTRLEAGERVAVVIKGFTSPRAKTDYNFNLGRRRISSVRNFFAAYADGALKPYLDDGRLKIQEASFGETTARAGISDNLADERNSIYHPDAARERRVEIVEIREN